MDWNKHPADIALLKGKTILLVEDNDLNRIIARTILTNYGITLIEAFDGAEAIDQLRNGKFDAVLMDLQMPVMDGLEATRIIRREIEPNIPIIALTANALKGDDQACLDAGMNAYIPKPYDERVLIEALVLWTTHRVDASAEGRII